MVYAFYFRANKKRKALPVQSYNNLVCGLIDCENICSRIWQNFLMLKSPEECKIYAKRLAGSCEQTWSICYFVDIQAFNDSTMTFWNLT